MPYSAPPSGAVVTVNSAIPAVFCAVAPGPGVFFPYVMVTFPVFAVRLEKIITISLLTFS